MNDNRQNGVVVLLATYNGARYLEEQIQSLEGQSHPPDCVIVRDDGSTDATLEILERWCARARERTSGSVQVEAGANLGFVGNFLALLQTLAALNMNPRALFFCDQDDVWMPNKIARGLALLEEAEEDAKGAPALVFTRLTVTNATLLPVAESPLHTRFDFGRALAENVVTGCTMVVNGALAHTLLAARPEPSRILAHDWWCYLIASGLGRVAFDPEPTIFYRQHGANVEGAARGGHLRTLARRVRGFVTGRWQKRRPAAMLAHFLALHGKALPAEKRALAEDFLLLSCGKTRAVMRVARGEVWRARRLDRVILFFSIVFRNKP